MNVGNIQLIMKIIHSPINKFMIQIQQNGCDHGTNSYCAYKFCQQLFCSYCTIDHQDHDFYTKQQLNELLINEMNQLKQLYDDINILKANIQQQITDIQEQVNKQIGILQEYLNKNENHISKLLKQFYYGNEKMNFMYQTNHIKTNLEQISNKLSKLSIVKNHQFSQELKHLDIFVKTSQNIIKNAKQSNSIALVIPKLSFDDETIITFKVKKLVHTIAIGICDLQTLESKNFMIDNWKKSGHGCYLISSSGYLYSTSNQNQNQVKTYFTYKDGQLIQIIFQPNQKLLFFRNLTNKREFLVFVNELRDYYACVYLSKENEEIEIVQ
ncbi:hypothetical protein pb186bvf_003620 [Paramecium bursaria]